MNPTFANILFFAGFILAVAGAAGDYKSSLHFIYYGLTEKNKLTRDKYGYFDAKKNLLFSAVFLGFIAVAGFYGVFAREPFVAMVAGVMALIPAGLRGRAFFQNEKKKKETREKQIKVLRELNAMTLRNAQEEELQSLFGQFVVRTESGRTFYELFGWVYSDTPDKSVAINDIQNRLAEISIKDESQWFPN